MTEPLRVLIVEDRPSDAELMVLRLEEEGYSPEWARVETEATFVTGLEAAPEVILADWTLPKFTGLRALRLVRGRGLDTAFVIVSGSVGEEAAIDAMHEGADDYVLKDRMARLGPAVRSAMERKRLREVQRLADAGLRQAAAVFDSSTEGVVLTALDGTIVAVNRAFMEITGYTDGEVLGRNPRILSSGRQDETFYRDLWATLTATGSWRGEIWNRRKDGRVYPEWLTISGVKDDEGRTTQFVGVFSDIGDVKKAQADLDFLAHHDALTGLPNRILLADRLEQALRRAGEESLMVGVMSLDIDRFGRVNDGLGHLVGDALLQAIAGRIAGCLGAEDSLARAGGDEFIIVVGRAATAANVAHRARDYLDCLATPFEIDGHQIVVTCSIGVSLFPADGSDADTLLRHAQATMRRSKSGGRNGFAFADAGLAREIETSLDLEHDLRGAAGRGELVVHYQPQVDLADRSLVGVEALVRWQHPQRGLIPPLIFIPIAEELGIIDEVGRWVLAEACQQVGLWQVDGFAVPRVAVNLSAQQLEHPDFAANVRSALEAADIGPERLELEVTESALMGHTPAAEAVLAQLRRLNVELVMDDFGTGYSSMAQLMRLPLRRLKVDISFVREIGNPAPEAIIRAIIAMATGLGLQTVAEGVEREDQHAFLRGAGCDIGQGYLYGRPVPADELLAAWGR